MAKQLGQQFDIEKEMWIPATKWLEAQGCEIKREFRTPWGICDLVGLQWAHDRVSERIRRRQHRQIGPPTRVAVLQLIPDEASGSSMTAGDVSACLGEPIEDVEKELVSLLRGRFINKHENGTFTSAANWAPLYREIIAIELKLNRIDEAIAQARSHIAFATSSFVGFPEQVSERILKSGRLLELEKAGVGLLSVKSDGATVLFAPNPVPTIAADPVLRMHSAERFWPHLTSKKA